MPKRCARYGAGEFSWARQDNAATVRTLNGSKELVREHYSHIKAGSLADQMISAFEERE